MSLDLLFNSSASQDDINKVAEAQLSSLSEESFKNFIDKLNLNEIKYNVLASLLLTLAQGLSKIKDLTLQIQCLRHLVTFLENNKIEDNKFDIYEIYANSLKENEFYTEAAKILEKFPIPSSDPDQLEYYLNIAECYFNDSNYDKVMSLFVNMNQHFFIRTTPIALLNRYFEFRGLVNVQKQSFLDAARCYNELWARGRTPELRQKGLRNAAICAILAPTKKNDFRSLFLHRYAADDNIKTIDIYPILDLIVRGKFIDKDARDVFKEQISDLVDIKDSRTLDNFSLQHNISVAQKMFVAIRIDRLAQIVGDTPSSVYTALNEMISSGSLKALIDQPSYSVEFESENKRALKDKSIQQFCLSIAELSGKIREFQS